MWSVIVIVFYLVFIQLLLKLNNTCYFISMLHYFPFSNAVTLKCDLRLSYLFLFGLSRLIHFYTHSGYFVLCQAGKGGELTHDETTIIAGALELTEKTASDAMTPISDTFAIDINARLDR